MHKRIQKWIQLLQVYANRWWYPPLIALLAFADLFLVVIPTDGLLISAAMLSPRRWIYCALIVSLGSSLGATALAHLISEHGLHLLQSISPGIDHTAAWTWTAGMMDRWGPVGLFLIALSPIMQHPAIALAALAGIGTNKIFLLVLAGRVPKYLFLAWIATHAPGLLKRLWGISDELEEVGISKESNPSISNKDGSRT